MDIINILPRTFCEQPIRNGDLIGVINALQYLRNKRNNQNIKFYMHPDIHGDAEYHKIFYEYIVNTTDFFSLIPNETYLPEAYLPYDSIMVWDFRDTIGDVVRILNNKPMNSEKICIVPVFDATYHTVRNWSPLLFNKIRKYYDSNWTGKEKYILAKELPIGYELGNFKLSTDFITNVEHIQDCSFYVGGDTGLTHYAAALERGPTMLNYFYSCREMIQTLPFHWRTKGTIYTYSTEYNLDLF